MDCKEAQILFAPHIMGDLEHGPGLYSQLEAHLLSCQACRERYEIRNQTIAFIEVPVTLQSENTIGVELRGKPGGLLVVEIVGVDNTPPIIGNLNPQNNSEIEERSPVISASYIDNIS